eukprot:TsM_000550600 transcript=TsM_000550600 gene=TsM_000550600
MSHSKDDGSNWGGWFGRQSPSKNSNNSGRGGGPLEEPPDEPSDLNPFLSAASAVCGTAIVVGGVMALAKYMGSDDDYYAALSTQIQQFFKEHRQSSETYQGKNRLKNDILSITWTLFPSSKLFIVSSSVNGFGLEESDLDLCLVISSQELRYNGACEVLMRIESLLKENGITSICTLIPARVPILRFRDALCDMSCDLNINNVVGIRNTHLLAMYTQGWLGLEEEQWCDEGVGSCVHTRCRVCQRLEYFS